MVELWSALSVAGRAGARPLDGGETFRSAKEVESVFLWVTIYAVPPFGELSRVAVGAGRADLGAACYREPSRVRPLGVCCFRRCCTRGGLLGCVASRAADRADHLEADDARGDTDRLVCSGLCTSGWNSMVFALLRQEALHDGILSELLFPVWPPVC